MDSVNPLVLFEGMESLKIPKSDSMMSDDMLWFANSHWDRFLGMMTAMTQVPVLTIAHQ